MIYHGKCMVYHGASMFYHNAFTHETLGTIVLEAVKSSENLKEMPSYRSLKKCFILEFR